MENNKNCLTVNPVQKHEVLNYTLDLFKLIEKDVFVKALEKARTNRIINFKEKEPSSEISIEKPLDSKAYAAFLEAVVFPGLVNVDAPKFIGHMTAPLPPLISDLQQCIAQLNQNLVKIETSGIGTYIEREVLSFFHQLFFKKNQKFYEKNKYDKEISLGNITSGGTLSNVTALSGALAKCLHHEDTNKSFKHIGLSKSLEINGYKDVVVLGSHHCHYSIKKAMRLMGLGTNAYKPIFFDTISKEKQEITLSNIIQGYKQQQILVLALVGTAGTTEAGKIDPLKVMGKVASKEDIHFHVDGAFGGAYILSKKLSYKLDGIEFADTITICAHKQLYLPMGISLSIFRDTDFAKYFEINSNYQARKEGADLGKFTIEGSRPFSALVLHGAFKIVRQKGYGNIIENNFDRCELFVNILRLYTCFELFEYPTLNIVLYRYIPEDLRTLATTKKQEEEKLKETNAFNIALQKKQFERGESFVSYTQLFPNIDSKVGTIWLRTVFMNPFTSRKDLIEILEEQIEIANELNEDVNIKMNNYKNQEYENK